MNNVTYVCIPCYESTQKLERTVEALQKNTSPPFELDIEVGKRSVVENKNILLSRAKRSGARYVSFCDDDVEPEPLWNAKMLTSVQKANTLGYRVGQVSPRIIFPDGKLFAAWTDIFIDPHKVRHCAENPGFGTSSADLYVAQAIVGALPGTCTIFTAPFLDRVDWTFDSRYAKSQFEDVDQSLLCRSNGFDLLYDGTTTVVHHTEAIMPRASDENFRKLFEKWGCHSELTMFTTNTRAGQTLQPPDSMFRVLRRRMNVRSLYSLTCNRLPQRLGTAWRVWRSRGAKAVFAHVKHIIDLKSIC